MNRLVYLDSLRGIAALIVVFFHLIDPIFLNFDFNLTESEIVNSKIILRSIFNGSDWVSFFFVLSGFSLSFSLLKSNDAFNFKTFIIKRFFRIYPLYLLILFVTYLSLNHQKSFFSFFSQTLLFNFNNELVPTSWSLSVEVIGSLLMPFFIIIFKSNKRTFYILTLISLIFYNGIGQSQSVFFGFSIHFLLGIALYHFFNEKQLFVSKNQRYLVLFFIVLSFCSRWFIDFFPTLKFLVHLFTDFMKMDYHHFFYILSAFGSFFFLYFVIINKTIQKYLSSKTLVFLGKISFSIYLSHFLILKLLLNETTNYLSFLENPMIRMFGTVLFLIFTIILVSTILFYTIEKPFIKFSNFLIHHKL